MNPGKTLIRAFRGEIPSHVPFWLMRQAGRYLPEYREIREQAGGFLDLAFNPELACEVTLQPIRRFGMDGAILFSDILVVPLALGQEVAFVAGEGPKLDPLQSADSLVRLSQDRLLETLAPVMETIRLVRSNLAREKFADTALIGFAGAPWTVATYMVEGGSTRDFLKTKRWAYGNPDSFSRLIDLLTEATISYLSAQIEAGAEAVKVFDSWAGVLDEQAFRAYVIAPMKRIVAALNAAYPGVPVIGFPRGAGILYPDYVTDTGVETVAIDQGVPVSWAASNLQKNSTVQGNLDPLHLLTGGVALQRAAEDILETLGSGPFIFNLGHGVHKETPPSHVKQLADIIKSFQRTQRERAHG